MQGLNYIQVIRCTVYWPSMLGLSTKKCIFGCEFSCSTQLSPLCVQLYMAPVTNAEKYSECIDFWRSVYGIDSKYCEEFMFATCNVVIFRRVPPRFLRKILVPRFKKINELFVKLVAVSAMLPLAKQCSFEEPCIETIPAESVLSWPIVVWK